MITILNGPVHYHFQIVYCNEIISGLFGLCLNTTNWGNLHKMVALPNISTICEAMLIFRIFMLGFHQRNNSSTLTQQLWKQAKMSEGISGNGANHSSDENKSRQKELSAPQPPPVENYVFTFSFSKSQISRMLQRLIRSFRALFQLFRLQG